MTTVLAPLLFLAGCVGTSGPVGPGGVSDPSNPNLCDLRGGEGCADDNDYQQVDARVIAELPVMGASALLDNEPMVCNGMVCEREVNEARTYTLSAVATHRLFVERQVSINENGEYTYDWTGEGMQCLAPNGFYVSEYMDYPDIETVVISGQVVVGNIGPAAGVCTGNTFLNFDTTWGGFRGTIPEDLSTITLENLESDGTLSYTEVLTKLE